MNSVVAVLVILLTLGVVGCGKSESIEPAAQSGPATLAGTFWLDLPAEEIKELGGVDRLPTITFNEAGRWTMKVPPDDETKGTYRLVGRQIQLQTADEPPEEMSFILEPGDKAIREEGEDPARFLKAKPAEPK